MRIEMVAKEQSKVEVLSEEPEQRHPVTHPLPAAFGDFYLKPGSVPEIPLEAFLVHQAHQGGVNALVVTRDGRTAYSAGQDGAVVQSVVIPNAEKFRTGDSDGSNAAIKTKKLLKSNRSILSIALSPDEKKLLICQFSTVFVYDIEAEAITNRLTQVTGRLLASAWDPKGELAAFGRANGDIFVWRLGFGPHPGENSLRAVETYEGAHSPIKKIIFHPSGRAFFAAEEEGFIRFWRLLRTEFSLGIRDESTAYDRRRRGNRSDRLQRVSGLISDIWLDKEGKYLFAVSSTGQLSSWKVRGLRGLGETALSKQTLFALSGFELANIPLLAVSGREQRFQVWCRFPWDTPVRQEDRTAPVLITEGQQNQSQPSSDSQRVGLVARSPLLRNPLLHITGTASGAEERPLLWAAEKTGNLLTFDAGFLAKSPVLLNQVTLCKDNLNESGKR